MPNSQRAEKTTQEMADETNRPQIDEVFWSQLVKNSSSDEEDAYIPGLSAPGNKRPSRVKGRRSQEVKGRRTKEVKAKIPVRQPIIESSEISQSEATIMYKDKPKKPILSKQREATVRFDKQEKLSTRDDSGMSTTFESFAERSIRRLQQASLKDLRPEDKQRVANLIKELARVGEEKEQVVKELYGEREQYERQLITMVQQQEKILQEREEIQEKLFQCQKLLTEYQAQLLNKQERLNTSIHQTREDPSYQERQSRSREPRSHGEPASRNKLEEYLANQNGDDESVSDLLLNQEERVKRPYTSMIDKEIAKERSLSRGSGDSNFSRSRSNSGSHGEGRPRFAYPQKLSGIGPLHEPLAHSTQKSMEIRAHNNDNESVRSRASVQGQDTKVKGQMNGMKVNDNSRNKVAFNDKEEYNIDAEMHSPNIKPPTQLFSDPDYAQYYKKLSPGGRKHELLKQRQALLDEQERLRKVLEKQEKQLQNRKYEYEKRKELQEQRMQFYKEGGKFPALKLDFEAGSEKEAGFSEAEDEGAGKGHIVRDDGSQVEMYSPHNDIQIDDEIHVKSRVSMGTSPMATPPRGNKNASATSPDNSQGSREDIPHLIDVATSISYRTPLKDSSNKQQGNLALGCNRQRMKELHMSSPRSEPLPGVHTPGEKTLNVLELVNSLQEEDAASTYRNRLQDDIENRPTRQYTPNKYITQGRQYTPDKYIAQGSQSSQYRQYSSLAQRGTSRGKLLDDQEDSIEEIKILEDIFFL